MQKTCGPIVFRIEKPPVRRSPDIHGCVHKVAESDPGSDTEITGFQPTFTNALCNDSWLLEWLVPI